MPTRLELLNRLASATSSEYYLGPGQSSPPRNARLHVDLATPTIIQPREGVRFLELTTGPQLVDKVTELMSAQPATLDVVINLFPRTIGAAVQAFQEVFLETAFLATTVLVGSGQSFEDRIDDIIRLSASATPAGRRFREMFSDPMRQPPPIDFLPGGLPGLPGLPQNLLTTAEALRRKGCAGAVNSALTRWGSAVSQATPRYLKDVIASLVPPDNCPGEEMTIFGQGLGDGTRSVVVFTGMGGHVVLTPATSILEWANDHIRLVIPAGAVRGPIGILVYPESPGEFATAASEALAEIGECFGPAVLMRMKKVLGGISWPPISAPPAQNDRANLYSGGPPIIDWFEVTPSGPLWPGRVIRLSWSIVGANSIEIVTRNVAGSPAHELPLISGPLPYVRGSVSVTVPGTRSWRGQYVLRAQNRCGVTEKTIELEMVLRKGLALGGGGTRGDFQVGALLYLYDQKGFRPDAIAGTSVGAINAIDLVMGDDPAPARSAAARLAATWLSLVDESSMWGEEPWLTQAKASSRQILRSLSLEGLLALPYSVVAGWIAKEDLEKLFKNPRTRGAVAIFNLAPIEARARAVYSQSRTNASGIKLRLVAISLETGELVMVDETGGVLQRGPQPTRLSTVPQAPATDVIDGAIASASMPGIFPARRLADHMCVDGGVKEVVPVQVAVRDLGCNQIFAIRCSARTALEETDPQRPFAQVMARSVLEMTFDEIADDDVAPFGGWPEGVTVTEIRPSFNLHDPMVVEPGLIRIAMDYGFMRAADILDVPESHRKYAMELSDRITRLRAANWILAHHANGVRYMDPHRGFFYFALRGATPTVPSEIRPVPDPEALDAIRNNCLQIRDALEQRLLINAPTPPTAVRTAWFTQWETFGGPTLIPTPWERFVSRLGVREAKAPPAPI